MSRESRKFKPGDIIRAVRGLSKNWTLGVPLRVTACNEEWAVIVESLDGAKFMVEGASPWVRPQDCELDVFLNAAHKAVQDA